MSLVTIRILPEHQPVVRRTFLSLYAVKAEAVHRAADDHLRGECSPDALQAHRAELAAIEAVIDQLGWEEGAQAEPVEVRGEQSLLRSGLVATLSDVLETLSERVPHSPDPSVDFAAIRRDFRNVESLVSTVEGLVPDTRCP